MAEATAGEVLEVMADEEAGDPLAVVIGTVVGTEVLGAVKVFGTLVVVWCVVCALVEVFEELVVEV